MTVSRGDTTFLEDLQSCAELSQSEIVELKTCLETGRAPDLQPELEKEATPELSAAAPDKAAALPQEGDMRTSLGQMPLPAKLKLAMFGNSTCRALLINDPNKLIQRAVLKNPRIGIAEVEMFSKNNNLSDIVLRIISDSSEWTRSYLVKLHLTVHPKAPADISLKWLRYLQVSDVKKIARSKNVPQLIAITARKRLAEEQKK